MVLLLVSSAAVRGGDQEPVWRARLDQEVGRIAGATEGTLHVHVRDLSSGGTFGWHHQDPTFLSSVVKLVVLLEVLRQVDQGSLSLKDRLTFDEHSIRHGPGPLSRARTSETFTVRHLLGFMMEQSDNAAADLLVARVGSSALERHVRWRGLRFGPLPSQLDLHQLVYAELEGAPSLTAQQVRDLGRSQTLSQRAAQLSSLFGRQPPWSGADLDAAFAAVYGRRIHSASMHEVTSLLEQIARCDRLSPGSCALANQLLSQCRTGGARIATALPDDWGWAHKTGTQHRRACDVGLLSLPDGRRVAIAACVAAFTRIDAAERALARVGYALVAAFGGRPASKPAKAGRSEAPGH